MPVFSTFGLIFLLALLSFIWIPLKNFINAGNTLYAITNRRIIIMDGILSTSVTSYGEDDIERIERRTYGSHQGDLVFRYEQRSRSYRSQVGRTIRTAME